MAVPKTIFSIRLDTTTLDELKAQAELERRSVSSLMEEAAEDIIKKLKERRALLDKGSKKA